MRGLVRDTIVELVDRKALWVFLGITLLAIVVTIVASQFTSLPNSDLGELDENGVLQPAGVVTERSLQSGVSSLAALLIFLTVMFTASTFPTMLERGRAEFYLSKPVSRSSLYLSKLTSVWLVYSSLIMICSMLVYATGAITNGVFGIGILYLFVYVLFAMALWLTITGLLGVLTGSTGSVVAVTILLWVAQFLASGHDKLKQVVTARFVTTVVDVVYYILPKDSEVAAMEDALAKGAPVESWLPLWSTALFALVMLFLAAQLFKRKSY